MEDIGVAILFASWVLLSHTCIAGYLQPRFMVQFHPHNNLQGAAQQVWPQKVPVVSKVSQNPDQQQSKFQYLSAAHLHQHLWQIHLCCICQFLILSQKVIYWYLTFILSHSTREVQLANRALQHVIRPTKLNLTTQNISSMMWWSCQDIINL